MVAKAMSLADAVSARPCLFSEHAFRDAGLHGAIFNPYLPAGRVTGTTGACPGISITTESKR
jgi:hypothetical protein